MDIIIENLTKRYGVQKAVDNISFMVKTGEVLGFLGPNGAGKTTTMRAITSYLKPDEGNIRIGNYSVKGNQEAVKKVIGYLPENNPLYTDMPVLDYMKFVAALNEIPRRMMKEKIYEMVKTCGLEGEKHKKIGELSKGYRQRVGLAQALIHDPQVLILDEPTAGLDPNQIIEIRDLIKRIGRQKTVILSSHILAEVEATCDRILIINKGKIVADGTAEDLRKRGKGSEILRVTIEEGDRNAVFSALQNLESVGIVDPVHQKENTFEIQSREGVSSRKPIFKLCTEKGWILTEMTPFEAKLEDIFRELTLN